MMIDTFVLYVLILDYLTLTLITGRRSARNLLRQLSQKVFNRFEWNVTHG